MVLEQRQASLTGTLHEEAKKSWNMLGPGDLRCHVVFFQPLVRTTPVCKDRWSSTASELVNW